jgi:hypothetical protein
VLLAGLLALSVPRCYWVWTFGSCHHPIGGRRAAAPGVERTDRELGPYKGKLSDEKSIV